LEVDVGLEAINIGKVWVGGDGSAGDAGVRNLPIGESVE
jgi:hypothetical protein